MEISKHETQGFERYTSCLKLPMRKEEIQHFSGPPVCTQLLLGTPVTPSIWKELANCLKLPERVTR